MSCPEEGHLRQLLNVFAYLKRNDYSWIVFNSEKFKIDWVPIKDKADPATRVELMKTIHLDAEDPDPPNMPTPLGIVIHFTCFCDANHAGNVITRRSQTGILIFANMTPINWLSKKENKIESSTFGSEFITLKHATEIIKGLKYK